MCVLDVLSMRLSTGISHWRLHPRSAVIDPLLSLTVHRGHRLGRNEHRLPRPGGLHPLIHHLRPQAARAAGRLLPSNPVSDLWSEKAARCSPPRFRTAFREEATSRRGDLGADGDLAGIEFGDSGVRVRTPAPAHRRPGEGSRPRLPAGRAIVPHGMAVSLTAPEAFRFSFPTCGASPGRHHPVGADQDELNDASERLPSAVVDADARHRDPNGVGAVGCTPEADIPDLVSGTIEAAAHPGQPAHSPVSENDIATIFARQWRTR